MFKVGIIGMGRTGIMFFSELKESCEIFGIVKEPEIEKIKQKLIIVKKNSKKEILMGNFISEKDFPAGIDFDFLFLTVKNPVFEPVKFYFEKIKKFGKKIPILFLSQNGIFAVEESNLALKEVFGEKIKELSIFRIVLFNPVTKKVFKDKEEITFSLPIKIGLAKAFGPAKEREIFNFFKNVKFKVKFFSEKNLKNMEYSKLFLNLLGMACASYGLSLKDGFSKKEIFLEEIEAIKEYKKVVKRARGKFLNFPNYPVKFLSFIFSLPNPILLLARNILAKIIEREREGKPKELDEIEYYNGAVVKLGEKFRIETKFNKEILKRAKLCLLKELG